MRLTLLGTGTSFGVPQISCDCAVCRSTDPRDRRTRSAALVELGSLAPDPAATLLIDTPPELRLQLLAARARRIDAVLYTHEHADHVHGIDDLRIYSIQREHALPVYGSETTLSYLRESYRYIFDPGSVAHAGTSKPRLELHLLEAGQTSEIAGAAVLPLAFAHGNGMVLGFRIGPLAYITDAKLVDGPARALLRGVELLVLNALWWRPHPTHLSIPEAIATAQAIGARRTVLTHLTHETGHTELAAQLPPGIEPGYDGQTLEVSA